ncbi:MAG: DUF6198 family protein [Clostridiaceae bacterium]
MRDKSYVIISKTILIILSCVLLAIGVSLFLQSAMGSDPISVLIDGFRRTFHLSFGTVQLIYNLILLFLAVLFSRKYIMIGTVASAMITGPLMNFFDPIILALVGAQPDLQSRIIMITTGQVILCFGVALNLATKFGFGALDALAVTFCEKFKLKYRNMKILLDLGHVIGGVLLGGVFGIGSILGVVAGGPFIAFFINWINGTIIRWLKLNEFAQEDEVTAPANP